MMERCLVCDGSRKIRLPLRYPASPIYSSADVSMDAKPSSKEFACPECAPTVPEERVAILEFGAVVRAHTDPRYENDVQRSAAHALVDELVAKGFVRFHKGKVDEFDRRYELTGRLGAVSTAAVASMEERIAERQTEVANEVADAAIEQVAHWGSHYTGAEGSIPKGMAIDAIRAAAKAVFEKRAASSFRAETTDII